MYKYSSLYIRACILYYHDELAECILYCGAVAHRDLLSFDKSSVSIENKELQRIDKVRGIK